MTAKIWAEAMEEWRKRGDLRSRYLRIVAAEDAVHLSFERALAGCGLGPRQKRADQAQSLNPYGAVRMAEARCILRVRVGAGYQDTHYLRTQSAAHVEWTIAAYSITSSARKDRLRDCDPERRWSPMAEEKYDVIDIAQPIESSRCRGLTVHS